MSLGRLGWLVIGTFHASLLIGTDLYLAGPSVESVRHGGADGRHLIPENNRHSCCDDDSSCHDGDGYRIVHPANMRREPPIFQPGTFCLSSSPLRDRGRFEPNLGIAEWYPSVSGRLVDRLRV